MSGVPDAFLLARELHSPERIRAALEDGLDPRDVVRGKSPVRWLTEMYTRSDRFPDCPRLLLEAGARQAPPSGNIPDRYLRSEGDA